ncbi:hypothetical protein [Roseateles sp. P5_E7]
MAEIRDEVRIDVQGVSRSDLVRLPFFPDGVRIVIAVGNDGLMSVSSTVAGRFDSSYAPMSAGRLLQRVLPELLREAAERTSRDRPDPS